MAEHFNKLTPEQAELLALLAEECAEVIQAVTKIQRFGLHGFYDEGDSNLDRLHKELGDVRGAMILLGRIKVIELKHIPGLARLKIEKARRYLKHHEVNNG